MAGFMTDPRQAVRRPVAGPHPQHPPVAAAGVPRRARRARRARRRREGHRLHGARRHGRGRRRADPGPGGRSPVLAGRHRRVAARADQGGRARALPGRDPASSSRGAACREGAAVRLRQDRHRRPGARACTSSAGSWCRAAAPRRRSPRPGCRSPTSPSSPASPAILGHRVVTLHPKVHGGLLADLDDPEHRGRPGARTASSRSTSSSSNLYPFVERPGDRADRHRRPGDGARRGQEPRPRRRRRRSRATTTPVLDELRATGALSARDAPAPGPQGVRPHRRLRRGDRRRGSTTATTGRRSAAAPRCTSPSSRVQELRYGENPHQAGARYRVDGDAQLVGRRRAARRQGAVVPQPLRRRGRVAARPPARRRPGRGDRQARQPVRRRRRRRHHRRVRRGPRVRPGLGVRRHRRRSTGR